MSDIVFVINRNTTGECFPRGLTTKVFPGEDGGVCVVEVKTACGIFKRPIVKICVLNFHCDSNEDHSGLNTEGRMI